MATIRLDPTRERVLPWPTPIGRRIREMFPEQADRIVEYFVGDVGRFCVGVWVSRSAGAVQELFSWGSMSEIGPAYMNRLRVWLSPNKWNPFKDARKQIASQQRRWKSELTDKSIEKEKQKAWLRRKVGTQYSDHWSLQ